MDNRISFRGNYKEIGIVFLIYILLSMAMTWPVVAQLGQQPVGGHVDQWTHLWTFHWIKQALLNGTNPLYSQDIFYPVGVSLVTHNIAWLNILLWLPLQAVVGETAAYNTLFLAIFALNGLTLYLFAYELTGSRLAAFIGGLIFAFWPYTLAHHDHPNMIFVSWLPLVLLYLRRAIISRERRDVWWAALFMALTGWARLHLLIMGSILIGLYALYQLASNYSRHTLWRLVAIGLLSALFILPSAAPLIISQLISENPEDIFLDEQSTQQSDLLTYFVPSYYHPLWGQGWLATLTDLYPEPERFIPRPPFLGCTTLLLLLSALVMGWRQGWFWGLTAVLIIFIALGPELRFNGQLFPQVPMPYRLIEDIYFIRLLRQPSRFNIVLGLPIAILAAQGLQLWLERLKTQRQAAIVTTLIAIVILFEYTAVPYPQTTYTTPAWFQQLADQPDDFAILNLPIQLFGDDKRHMFDQVTHGKAIVNGKVARVPREALAFLNSTPFLQGLQRNIVDFNEVAVTQQLRPLAEANVRYLVLHKDLLTDDELLGWQQWLGWPPVHQDQRLVVYATAPQIGQDMPVAYPLTAEIGLIQAQLLTSQANPLGLVQAQLLWGSTAVPPANYEVCLNLQQATTISQSSCSPIAAEWTTTEWSANEVVHGTYSFQVEPTVVADEYEVAVTLREVGGETVVTPSAPLGSITIAPATSPPQWENLITLTDYTIQPTVTHLELTFYWQAIQKMDTSYKIFVHLPEARTGELVAQLDTFPVGWTYLTNQWQVGEIIEDHMSLALEDVPPGQYQLFVGFYDEESGERLSTNSPDNSVLLSGYGR